MRSAGIDAIFQVGTEIVPGQDIEEVLFSLTTDECWTMMLSSPREMEMVMVMEVEIVSCR